MARVVQGVLQLGQQHPDVHADQLVHVHQLVQEAQGDLQMVQVPQGDLEVRWSILILSSPGGPGSPHDPGSPVSPGDPGSPVSPHDPGSPVSPHGPGGPAGSSRWSGCSSGTIWSRGFRFSWLTSR